MTRENFKQAFIYFYPKANAFQLMRAWNEWTYTDKLNLIQDYGRR